MSALHTYLNPSRTRLAKVRLSAPCVALLSIVWGLAATQAAAATAEAQAPLVDIVVRAGSPGAEIAPTLYGVFFEDINFGGDGGLCAELVKNRSFEFTDPITGWAKIETTGAVGGIEFRREEPCFAANPMYARLNAERAGRGFGLRNDGFRGMGVRKGERYRFSAYVRLSRGGARDLRVEIQGAGRRAIGKGTVRVQGEGWREVRCEIPVDDTQAKASLAVLMDEAGAVDIDGVSLLPARTWSGGANRLRADLVEMLAALKPGFVRFPGGCIVEGRTLALRYQWKRTIGPREERPVLINRWNVEFLHRPTVDYFQSFDLGFLEYFQLCEDLSAAPLPILNCGMACQFNSGELAPLDALDPYIQDALDLIEFANGPVTSPWGRRRAELGHPKPFGLRHLGVGNEQWGPQYLERFARFAAVLKARYPEVQLIAAAGPGPDGEHFNLAWPRLRDLRADIVDEHCYAKPEWFLDQSRRYDGYARSGPKVFMGEYAAQSVGTARVENRNTWACALAEAAFLTGIERNAAVVTLSSYAPLFAHVDAWQWTPNLIWFDNLRAYGTPNYYVQQAFSLNRGDRVLPVELRGEPQAPNGQPRFYAAASLDARSGDLLLKVVNATEVARPIAVRIEGATVAATEVRLQELAASDPNTENAFETPTRIAPRQESVAMSGGLLRHTVAAQSLTVFRMRTGGQAAAPAPVTAPASASVSGPAHDYPVQPVPLSAVRLTGGLWKTRQEVNRTVTAPFALQQCEDSKRVLNFDLAAETMRRRAAGETTFQHKPPTKFPFDDSDVFKAIEGVAFALSGHRDPALEARVNAIIGRIGAAQEPDGYLYTWRTMHPDAPAHKWIDPKRWLKDHEVSHELYNIGHLYEAGVAWYELTGNRNLLDICLMSAELVHRDFGGGQLRIAPGHQVIEMGLAKLYRVTGDRRWLDLAKFFLDVRGPGKPAYNQQHLRVVEQREAVGHAVRANYMYAGMADVAALTGDTSYLNAITAIWENVVGRKWHLTGGCGALAKGEAYGADYELPSDCYNETCAAIAFLFWNHRMFLMTGDGRYMDAFERALYNGVASGVSLSGDRFFYPNPLVYDGEKKNNHGYAGRAPWFGCACCPPNILRLIGSLGGYAYAVQKDRLTVNLYLASEARATVAGHPVGILQATDYPWDGRVRLTLQPDRPRAFTLSLRLPGWVLGKPVPGDLYHYENDDAAHWKVRVAGKTENAPVKDGYVSLNRVWQKGDTVELELPMPVRRVRAHASVASLRGQVALERGPLVYCFEGCDQKDPVLDLVLPEEARITASEKPGLLGGITVLQVVGAAAAQRDGALRETSGTAIPYYAWNNRGLHPMTVWLGREAEHTARRGLPETPKGKTK